MLGNSRPGASDESGRLDQSPLTVRGNLLPNVATRAYERAGSRAVEEGGSFFYHLVMNATLCYVHVLAAQRLCSVVEVET